MAIPRNRLVDPTVTRWYHCISRCVRQAHLCSDQHGERKDWLERRLERLTTTFAISVAGYAILDSHLHVLLRIDTDVADGWSNEEVAIRWAQIYPPRNACRRPIPISEEWLQDRCRDEHWIETRRARLKNLSWFMKCLKEDLARRANRQDGCSGAFFEGRFKSIPVEDEESLLAVCTYVDLNPFAAGVASLPELGPYTSLRNRLEAAESVVAIPDMATDDRRGKSARRKVHQLELTRWLCPLDLQPLSESPREGMLPGLSLAQYLQVVDFTARRFREGKARLSSGAADIFARLALDQDSWCRRIKKLTTGIWHQRALHKSSSRGIAVA
jgi:hypothetical protein